MKSITATEFKAQCLRILDNVPPGGLEVTKRGKTVARVFPAPKKSIIEFYGCMPDLKSEGDLFSTGIKWNAES
jgi:antitoxin (DNA-binding transcriptional repressor) of toxin-antitoxin stability system